MLSRARKTSYLYGRRFYSINVKRPSRHSKRHRKPRITQGLSVSSAILGSNFSQVYSVFFSCFLYILCLFFLLFSILYIFTPIISIKTVSSKTNQKEKQPASSKLLIFIIIGTCFVPIFYIVKKKSEVHPECTFTISRILKQGVYPTSLSCQP